MINSKYILAVTEKCNIYTAEIQNYTGNCLEINISS